MTILPNGWILAALHELVLIPTTDIVDGPFGSNLKASEYIDSGVPIIRLQNVARNEFIDKNIKYISASKARSLERHTFNSGDIVITKLGDPLGKAAIVPEDLPYGVIVSDIVRMRVVEDLVDARYICYAINSEQVSKALAVETKGSTRARVNLKDIRELRIPLPPLREQTNIADKLDVIVESINSSKIKIDTLASRVEILRRTVLKQAVSGKLAGIEQDVDSSETWTSSNIESIGIVGTGSTPLRSRADYFTENGGTPWITSSATGDAFIVASKENVTDLAIKECRLKVFPVGTLVVAMYGEGKTRGQVAELCIDATVNQACATIVVDETKALPAFVKLILQANYLEMRELAEGGNQPNLNLSKIKKFPVKVPSLAVQQDIVTVVSMILDRLKDVTDKLISLNKTLNEVLPSAIAKAFRGQLVPHLSTTSAESILTTIYHKRSQVLGSSKGMPVVEELKSIEESSAALGDIVKSVNQALEDAKGALSTQELFSACGHSRAAPTQDVEVFFLELRDLLKQSKITVDRRGTEDFFSICEGSK